MGVFIVEYRSTGGALRSKGDEYVQAQQARKAFRQQLNDRLILAGSKFETTSQSQAISSIMVLEADDLEAARTIAADDPYLRIGEFSGFTVNELAVTSFNPEFRPAG